MWQGLWTSLFTILLAVFDCRCVLSGRTWRAVHFIFTRYRPEPHTPSTFPSQLYQFEPHTPSTCRSHAVNLSLTRYQFEPHTLSTCPSHANNLNLTRRQLVPHTLSTSTSHAVNLSLTLYQLQHHTLSTCPSHSIKLNLTRCNTMWTECSALMHHVTRFTEEIFSALISCIFIIEALISVVRVYEVGAYTRPLLSST